MGAQGESGRKECGSQHTSPCGQTPNQPPIQQPLVYFILKTKNPVKSHCVTIISEFPADSVPDPSAIGVQPTAVQSTY